MNAAFNDLEWQFPEYRLLGDNHCTQHLGAYDLLQCLSRDKANVDSGPVPNILCDERYRGKQPRNGSLRDAAPTLLELLGLARRSGMTGSSLVEPYVVQAFRPVAALKAGLRPRQP